VIKVVTSANESLGSFI